MKKFLWIVGISLLFIMLFTLFACNKKKDETGVFTYSNGEYSYELDISSSDFKLTVTHQNGYLKEVTVSKGSYTYFNNIYALEREEEKVYEYAFNLSGDPINTYDNDMSYVDKIYVQELNENLLIVDGKFAVARNGEYGSSLSPLAVYSQKKTYTSVDAVVAKGANAAALAKALKLGMVYEDLFCQDIILTSNNIATFNSTNLGNTTAQIIYKGKTYTAQVSVVEPGLEKELDISMLPNVVKRGYSLTQFVSDNPKVLFDGNLIDLKASMVSGYNAQTAGLITITVTYQGVSATKTIKVYNPDVTNEYLRIDSTNHGESIFFPVSQVPKNISSYISSVNFVKPDESIYPLNSGWSATGLEDTKAGANFVNISYTKNDVEYKYTQPFFFYNGGEIYSDSGIQYIGSNTCAYVKNGQLELVSGSDKLRYFIKKIGKPETTNVLKLDNIQGFDVARVTSVGTEFIVPIQTYDSGEYTFYLHLLVKTA